MIDLQQPTRETVWLFHGTSESVAKQIMKGGWDPPDPPEVVEQYAIEHGVSVDVLWPGQVGLGSQRHGAGAASCSTGWMLAAAYARNGPEYLYHVRGTFEGLRQGVGGFRHPAPESARAAVFLIRIPWTTLADEAVRGRAKLSRDAMLPDSRPWDVSDFFHAMENLPREVVIPGVLLQKHLVAVDWVSTDCTCSGSIESRPGVPEGNFLDLRQRCDHCYLAETPL